MHSEVLKHNDDDHDDNDDDDHEPSSSSSSPFARNAGIKQTMAKSRTNPLS